MKKYQNWMLSIQLFAYWYAIAGGYDTPVGIVLFVIAAVLSVLSIRTGLVSFINDREGEGLALAVVGILVFVGLTARWFVSFRMHIPFS